MTTLRPDPNADTTTSSSYDTRSRTRLGKVVTPPGRDWAAFTLAIALGTSVNLVTIAVLVNALSNTPDVGLSENATQLLTNAFSGIVGLLGSYIGFRAGSEARNRSGEDGEPGEPGGQGPAGKTGRAGPAGPAGGSDIPDPLRVTVEPRDRKTEMS